MVKPVATITVVPNLPESLHRLAELAYNLRWAWDHDAIDLFRRLDRDLWETTAHNPVSMLGMMSQERLIAAAEDPAFMAHYNRVCNDYDLYMGSSDTWYNMTYGHVPTPIIAYFSMEFGITE